MGQPITVVEKPSSNPAVLRFETNRPLSGMGHERYTEPPPSCSTRPVDELARRLFAAGGVESVHINGSVVTVTLGGGHTGATGLADIVRGLFLPLRRRSPPPGRTPPDGRGPHDARGDGRSGRGASRPGGRGAGGRGTCRRRLRRRRSGPGGDGRTWA